MEATTTRKTRRAAPKTPKLDAKAPKLDAKAPEQTQPAEAPEQVRAARNLEAAREEARVLGVTFEDACASMGIDPETGQPVEQEEKSGYAGPMLALRRRLKAGAYQKAANGQPCCGDAIAVLCGQYTREVIVKALVAALGLPGNPYAHLNPGQQSMNLRSKARAAVKSGQLELATIEAALVAAAAANG